MISTKLDHLSWGAIIKIAVTVNLFVALNITALYYIFPFSKGTSYAPFIVRASDEIVIVGSFLTFLLYFTFRSDLSSIRKLFLNRLDVQLVALLYFLWILIAAILASSSSTLPLAYQMAKSFLLPSWLCFLILAQRDRDLTSLLRTCAIIFMGSVFFQVAFSVFLSEVMPSLALWSDDPYVGYVPFTGFLLNPNRFGFALNLALAISLALLWFVKSTGTRVALSLIAIFLNIATIRTGSLSQVLISFGLLAYFVLLVGFNRGWVALIGVLVLASCAGQIALFPAPFGDTIHNTLVADLVCGSKVVGYPESCAFHSDSITTRLLDLEKVKKVLEEPRVVNLLFGKLPERHYIHAHGDFWFVFLQAGLLGLFCLVIPLASIGLLSLRQFFKNQEIQYQSCFLAIHLMLACFAATFLVDNVIFDAPTGLLFSLCLSIGFAIWHFRSGERGGFRLEEA